MKYLIIFIFMLSSLHAEEFIEKYHNFAEKYCYNCHDEDVQKGDFRMDNLKLDLSDLENVETWQVIQQVLVDGDMPPKKKKQPKDSEKQQLIDAIDLLFANNESQLAEENRALRQLTPYQLQNSLRDLLDIDQVTPEMFAAYPESLINSEFDTMGSELKLTFGQVKSLSNITREILTRPRTILDRPAKTINVTFTQNDAVAESTFRHDFKHKPIQLISTRYFPLNIKERLKHSLKKESKIRLQLKVKGINNHDKMSEDIFKENYYKFRDVKPAVSLYLLGSGSLEYRTEIKIADYQLTPNEEFIIDEQIIIPENYTLHIKYETAVGHTLLRNTLKLFGFKGFYVKLPSHLLRDARRSGTLEQYENLSNDEQMDAYNKIKYDYLSFMNRKVDQFDFPNLSIYDLQITEINIQPKNIIKEKQQLKEFAAKAFRRPVTDDEISSYLTFFDRKDGYIQALQAIIGSPQFIYHTENPGQLNAYSLASRLSYSLWGSLPDEKLFKLAEDNSLTNIDVLVSEIHRMLDDKKSKALTDDFLYQWMHFSHLDKMAPDRKKFNFYYKYNFKNDIIKETKLFFRYLLDNNLSVKNFVNSDFTFMNSNLADYYGIKLEKPTSSFQKVSLKSKPERGGFIGQAAVLTATANGVDTSPIVRGIWFSEKIFNIVPPPPPAGVDTTPDTTKADTVKELFAMHSEDISCNRCHSKIDPLEFSLENYDAVGQWRENYEDGKVIDAEGEYKGISFKNIMELKEGLKDKTAVIAEGFVKKLLTYSLGRKMTPKDLLEIKRIVSATEEDDFRLKDLVVQSLTSDIFLKR